MPADAGATASRTPRTKPPREDMRLSIRMHDGFQAGRHAHACANARTRPVQLRGGVRRTFISPGRSQISGYPAPKPSRPQPSFCDAGPTVVSV
ncbi:hypothetical protein C7H84_00945 [Burkholderia sp. Nafp2/4-1b]|nr:hypothetical protein C7H84_00945 [Burkholderia sp. Nafp2/4-1b]